MLESTEAKFVRMIVDEEVTRIFNNFCLLIKPKMDNFEVNWFMLAIQDSEKKMVIIKAVRLELAM